MPVVCIAGMHRSGTSLVARLLNLCGMYLGKDEELMPPTEDNPDGYWENTRFVEINDGLLSQLNGTWAVPPSSDSILEMQKQPLVLIERSQALIREFDGQMVWGWKDPRNSLTLPFWQQLIPELKVVISLRNPLEVAHSMARRDKFSIAFGLDLWHTYYQRLLSAAAPENRITTHYGTYFVDARDELERLLGFIGLQVDKKAVEMACAAAKQSLKHNRASLEYLIAEGAPLKVVNLYAELCSQAGAVYWNGIKNNASELTVTGEDGERNVEYGLLQRLVDKDPIVSVLATHLAKKEQAVQALTAEVAEKGQAVQALTAEAAEKGQAVQALTAEVAEKGQAVQALTAEVAEKGQAVQVLTAEAAEKGQAVQALSSQLAEIKRSKAWRLALALRQLRIALVPPNSLRARVVRLLLNGMYAPARRIRRNGKLDADARLVRSSDLFDAAWYLSHNADVAEARVDPLRHYLQFGGFERRDPSPEFRSGWYLDTYEDVRAAGENPLVHYLAYGKQEGRVTLPEPEFQLSSEFRVSSGTIAMSRNKKSNEIAVVLHLFYEELFEEIKDYLHNIGGFDLYISMPRSKAELEAEIFASFPEARILYTPNRGRDLLPFIAIYRNLGSLDYKCILKIHTKKSPHREDGDIWRSDMYGKLMGSPKIIESVLSAFGNRPNIGIIAPKGHLISNRIYWGANKKKTQELARRVGIDVKDDSTFSFAAGSMFWAKPEALRYLTLLPLEFDEFESEPLGPDGALVHALERFVGLTVKDAGYAICEVDEQGNISDATEGPPNEFYPFGVAEGLQVVGQSKQTRHPAPDTSHVSRPANLADRGRSLGSFVYQNRQKAIRELVRVIRHPRDPRSVKTISRSIDLVRGRLNLPDSGQKQIVQSATSMIPEHVELTDHLAGRLLNCLGNGKYVIAISQSDYMGVVGGVEIAVTEEQQAYNRKGIDYLHVFPYPRPRVRLASENESLYIGINCNGERVGVTDRGGLLSSLSQLDHGRLLNIIIHHTMGFDLELVNRILQDIGGGKGRFWLHDNFSLCPGYTLLRNDLVYCGAPDLNSNACLICKHGSVRRVQQPAFAKLFEANDLQVVAPSRFALDLWKEKSSFAPASEKVSAHATLDWNGTLPARQSTAPLRIGFPGYPVRWKGWDTWMELVKRFSGDDRYRFYCFTSWSSKYEKMKWVSVAATKDDRLSMAKALRENEIDVAFLWSLCPETFSFTLYESLAAGCYALTYKDSGNIQAYLKHNPNCGSVLESEEALFRLFSGDDLSLVVANYQKNGRPQADLVFHAGLE